MYTYKEYKENIKKFDFKNVTKNDWIFYVEIRETDNMPYYSEWKEVFKNDFENKRIFVTKHVSIPYGEIRKITDRWGNILYDDGKDYTPINEQTN